MPLSPPHPVKEPAKRAARECGSEDESKCKTGRIGHPVIRPAKNDRKPKLDSKQESYQREGTVLALPGRAITDPKQKCIGADQAVNRREAADQGKLVTCQAGKNQGSKCAAAEEQDKDSEVAQHFAHELPHGQEEHDDKNRVGEALMDERIGDEPAKMLGRPVAGFDDPGQKRPVEGKIPYRFRAPANACRPANVPPGAKRQYRFDHEDHHCQGRDSWRQGIECRLRMIVLHRLPFLTEKQALGKGREQENPEDRSHMPATAFTPRVFSGIQPSGGLTLGNYLGALKRFVDIQNDGKQECIYCLVDLHAITTWQEPDDLVRNTREAAAAFMASGIDPRRSILFNQSQVPEHAQLAWIFNCVARMGWMGRMTQWKDKAGKNAENASLGLFAYPALMAADILVYHATHVPVGEDQKQHLELTRDIAAKFNHDYKVDFFPITEPMIEGPATRVMSLRDGRKKMSKSDASDMSRINLSDGADTIALKFRKARTDAEPLPETYGELEERPEARNLIDIYAGPYGAVSGCGHDRSRGPGMGNVQAASRRSCGRDPGADHERDEPPSR